MMPPITYQHLKISLYDLPHPNNRASAIYRIALIEPRGRSLVVTRRTADFQVTSDRPVTMGLIPVELSTSTSGRHAAKYVVNACVSEMRVYLR